jgi:hypothetical protein
MTTRHEDSLLRAAFAPARQLEPTGAEVERVLARVQARRRMPRLRPLAGWRRLAVPALAALALLSAGLCAVPPTRAAIEGAVETVAEAFTGYTRGDSTGAPGRPLGRSERAPHYFGGRVHGLPFARDPRVLAEAGGYKLFAYRAPSGSLSFDLGETGVGMGFEDAKEIGPGAIYVLGPGSMSYADRDGHVPLFGLAADTVREVELRYGLGPPLRVKGVAGAFVLLVEPSRKPREVVAFDARGDRVAHQSLDYPDGNPVSNSWDRYVRPSAKAPSHP